MARVQNKLNNNDVKLYKNIPICETGSRTVCLDGKFLITHCPEKERFTLWKVHNEGYEKIDTSSSPLTFDEIIPWNRLN